MQRLLLLSFLASGFIYGQAPVIELSDVYLDIGGRATWQQCENAENGGASGANVTWDFSQLDTIDNQIFWNALDPADTPFSDSFPTANFVYYLPVESILSENAETYQYYRFDLDDNRVDLLGFVVPFTIDQDSLMLEDTLFTIFDDPLQQGQLPLEFGESFTDTFSYRSRFIVDNENLDTTLVLTTEITGVTTTTADGYGTLITPAATYQNALRTKTTQVRTSRVLEIPGPSTVMRADAYNWYSAGTQFTLLSIDSQMVAPPGIPIHDPDQLRLQLSTFYLTDISSTAVQNVSPEKLQFSVYPNPVNERLTAAFTLETAGQVSIQLIGTNGRLLRSIDDHYPAGSHQRELWLTNLPPGGYSLTVETPAGRATRRVILQ